jgi:hypothetical protein
MLAVSDRSWQCLAAAWHGELCLDATIPVAPRRVGVGHDACRAEGRYHFDQEREEERETKTNIAHAQLTAGEPCE